MTKNLMMLLLLTLTLTLTSGLAGAADENPKAAHFPAWLQSNECKYDNFQFTGLPPNMTHVVNFPPDAYNRNICTSIKPVPTAEAAAADPAVDKVRRDKLAFLSTQYDLFAWVGFIILNREVNDKFEITQTNLKAGGDPVWLNWRESDSVFLSDGSKPPAWSFSTNKSQHTPVIDTITQVGPTHVKNTVVVDQNNNPLYYQKYVNPILFNYITEMQTLYNLDGQTQYSVDHGCKPGSQSCLNLALGAYIFCNDSTPETPISCTGKPDLAQYSVDDTTGVVELKVAWKRLTENDPNNARYLTTRATIQTYTNNDPTKPAALVSNALLGMVGFHLNHKTASSFRWVFSTFTQVDNINPPVNAPVTPSVFNPDCPTCAVNIANNGATKTQVKLMDPPSPITEAINGLVQAELAKENSVLQYYQLVGSQFITDFTNPDTSTPANTLMNQSGGNPHPTYVTNEVIETFLQPGNTDFDGTTLYDSSSCMGCHVDGGLAYCSLDDNGDVKVSFPKLTGDFSFIFFEASWKVKPTACPTK
jgi:hypothetical protein